MKVLITGANGQLGYALQKTSEIFSSQHVLMLIALARTEMDLAQLEKITEVLDAYAPDAVINAAAYTAVDKAEVDEASARLINVDAVQKMARWCHANNKTFIQVSTDFVFDGEKSKPYSPNDKTNPLGIYGRTKLAGEELALEECKNTYIVRTGWVYCEHGANFVKTILRLAVERDQLEIVGDQIGTPTYAIHLAEILWLLLLRKPQQKIWHFSDAGVASWYDFAVAITEEAKHMGLLNKIPHIKSIATEDYLTPARRPAFSVLDKKATWEELQIIPMHWQAALVKMLAALK